jgi:hypothetical protein
MEDSCEYGNEPSDSVMEVVELISNWWHLNKDSAPL